MKYKKSPQSKSRTGKVCALVAASLILPALAYAGHDHFKGGNGENNGKGNYHENNDRDNDHSPPMVTTPEANTGMVLIPFVGAVLLFSSLQLFRAKAAQKNGARP